MTTKSINREAFKAGIWYTVTNLLFRGVGVITTPVFTRMMSKQDYGDFTNYSAWIGFLTILTTLDLYSSVARAKFDYRERLDQYVASIQILGSVFALVCYLAVCIFMDLFEVLFGMPSPYIHVMFIYMIVSPSFQLLQTKHRQFLKYMQVTVMAGISTLLGALVSVVLVLQLENDFAARVIGSTGVMFVLCLGIYIYNLKLADSIDTHMWRYALMISVPLIPHLLSGNVLGTFDRVLIKQYCGSEMTALYGVIYIMAQVLMMIFGSVNQAWSPWFYEQLYGGHYALIRKASNVYLLLVSVTVIFVMLIGPESVLLFAGEAYLDSIVIMPAIMLGCYFWWLYTFYVNLEIYHKKTISISVKTMVAAVVNLLLNLLLIPRYGWTAAAYTTLVSYMLLFVMHSRTGIALGAGIYYSLKAHYLAGGSMSLIMLIMMVLYDNPVLRHVAIGIFLLVGVVLIYRYRIIVRKTVSMILNR